jgi:hypothetical protein
MLNNKNAEKITKEQFFEQNVSEAFNLNGDKIAEMVVLVSSDKPLKEVLEGIIDSAGIGIGKVEDIKSVTEEYTPEYIPNLEEIGTTVGEGLGGMVGLLNEPSGKTEVLRGLMLIIEEIWDEKKDYEVNIVDEIGTNIFGGSYKTGRKVMTLKYRE